MRTSGIRRRKSRSKRNSQGIYLVESLVAIILGALLTFLLLDMLSQTMRVTSSNVNQQDAALIAQTVLDAVKASNFSQLQIGTYPLLVNSTTAGEIAPAGHPLPVGLNIGSLNWTAKSTGNQFQGTVVLDIQKAADPTLLNAVVSVSWADSQTQITKTVATMTTLHPAGINYWP